MPRLQLPNCQRTLLSGLARKKLARGASQTEVGTAIADTTLIDWSLATRCEFFFKLTCRGKGILQLSIPFVKQLAKIFSCLGSHSLADDAALLGRPSLANKPHLGKLAWLGRRLTILGAIRKRLNQKILSPLTPEDCLPNCIVMQSGPTQILQENPESVNGDDRDRTDNPRLAKAVLSQLSYVPGKS